MSSSEVVAPQSLDMSIKADESPKKLPEHPEAEFEPVLKLDKLEEGLRHEDFSHDTEDREDHTFCGIMVVSARKCPLTELAVNCSICGYRVFGGCRGAPRRLVLGAHQCVHRSTISHVYPVTTRQHSRSGTGFLVQRRTSLTVTGTRLPASTSVPRQGFLAVVTPVERKKERKKECMKGRKKEIPCKKGVAEDIIGPWWV